MRRHTTDDRAGSDQARAVLPVPQAGLKRLRWHHGSLMVRNGGGGDAEGGAGATGRPHPRPGEKTWLIADVLAYHVVLLGDICFC